ncbi:MAG: acyltransferase family protein [Patescibacteria group bacterium]|nr:acyltransferase family protein [Patescibacteria group bacterium]
MRYSLIDLFRTIAIVLVFFFHISIEINPIWGRVFINFGNIYRFNTGDLGIAIFIIISGLCLTLRYKNKKIEYVKFITQRFLKIYPPFFIALIMGVIFYYILPDTLLQEGYYYFPQINTADIFCSLTGFCNFLGRIGGPFLGPSWFIGLIIVLYLLFPLLLKKFKTNPYASLFILFLISLIFRYLYNNFPPLIYKLQPFFPLDYLFEFGLGIYLGLVVKNNFWTYLNKYKKLSRILIRLGLLSFPLFLVHHPLLFIVNSLEKLNVSLFVSIPLYLLVSGVFSFLLFKMIKKIPRKI